MVEDVGVEDLGFLPNLGNALDNDRASPASGFGDGGRCRASVCGELLVMEGEGAHG